MRRGRPPVPAEIAAAVLELRKSGMGYGRIARELGIGRTTVRRILAERRREKGGLYSSEHAGGPGP